MKATIRPSELWKRFGPSLAAAGIACLPALGHAQAPSEEDTPPVAEQEETDYRPKKYSSLRYSKSINNNPFERDILPPQKAAPPPKADPFDFKLVSISGRGERYRVVVVDKKGKYKVITDKPDADGFHFTSIEPTPKIQDASVVVTNGGQTETVEFDTKRFSIAAKPIAAPKAATNSRGRPNVVPTSRPSTSRTGRPSARTRWCSRPRTSSSRFATRTASGRSCSVVTPARRTATSWPPRPAPST